MGFYITYAGQPVFYAKALMFYIFYIIHPKGMVFYISYLALCGFYPFRFSPYLFHVSVQNIYVRAFSSKQASRRASKPQRPVETSLAEMMFEIIGIGPAACDLY